MFGNVSLCSIYTKPILKNAAAGWQLAAAFFVGHVSCPWPLIMSLLFASWSLVFGGFRLGFPVYKTHMFLIWIAFHFQK